jgi:hypothetical protein
MTVKDYGHKQYLGDGAYAHFDGYQLWVTTENGIETTNEVALEPMVWQALVAYVDALKGREADRE